MANSLIKMLEARMYAANRKVRAVPGDAPTPEWRRLLAEANHAASEYETAMLKAASSKEDE